MSDEQSPQKQVWLRTGTKNLFKLAEYGTYYGRIKLNQKNYRKSFGTTDYNVARRELTKWMAGFEKPEKPRGSGTFGGMVEPYFSWLEDEKILTHVTDGTIFYKREILDQIDRTWKDFRKFPLADLTEDGLKGWVVAHRKKYSPTRTNGALTVIREICDLAVRKKFVTKEAWDGAKGGLVFVPLVKHSLQLPEPAQVEMLRNEVYMRCQRRGTLGGWLFDFLLFSGCRIDSASSALWEDVHWGAGELRFRKAKRGEYTIPLFPQLKDLLERLREEYPDAQPTDRILPTISLQTVLTSACRAVKVPHMSHHTLRHLFATRCIEAGVDIPTVSRWLGHKDGGALAMKTYGHLRQTHSQQQAATVDFLPKPQQTATKCETPTPTQTAS
jgi:integrase